MLKLLKISMIALAINFALYATSYATQDNLPQAHPKEKPATQTKKETNHITQDIHRAFILSSIAYNQSGIEGVEVASQHCHQKAQAYSLQCYFVDVMGLVLLQEVELQHGLTNNQHYFSRQNIESRSESLFKMIEQTSQQKITQKHRNDTFDDIYQMYKELVKELNPKKSGR